MNELERISWMAISVKLFANTVPYIQDHNWQDKEVRKPTQEEVIEIFNELEQERQQLLADKLVAKDNPGRDTSIY